MKRVYDGIWKDMVETYREMELSESEIAERILCKTTRCIDGTLHLDECDETPQQKQKAKRWKKGINM